jgi:predicted RNA methylase
LTEPRDPLGEQLERDVPAARRHGKGQYFTPDPLVDFVLDLAGRPWPGDVVLDPACGTGRFLLAARQRWPRVTLCGCETDPPALDAARAQLPEAVIHPCDFLTEPLRDKVDLVIGNPPYVRDRGRKRDLYVDFVERSLDNLSDGGRLALVLSNAWLDVGYGRHVREMLLERCATEWIVESAAERWFPGAKVNTMVLVARKCADPAVRAASEVRFAEVRAPLPAPPVVVRTVRQELLPAGAPWGPLLRAPDLYFELLDSTVPLGELARVERGWTTNDNGFFYPPPDSGIEAEWLRPLLKGPRRATGVRFEEADLPERAFVCDATRDGLVRRGHRGTLDWLDRHERTEWRLKPQAPARLFLVKGHHDRLRHPVARTPVHADQQLYLVRPKTTSPQLDLIGPGACHAVDAELLAAVLNSSWGLLAAELTGRVNFGDGVLWLGLRDARERLQLPDVSKALPPSKERLRRAFAALPDGPVPAAAAEAHDPAWAPARHALDAAVGLLLGLDPEGQELIRHERLRLCRRRLELAASAR